MFRAMSDCQILHPDPQEQEDGKLCASINCKCGHLSLLSTTRDVSRGGTSVPQPQKFPTANIKSVQNLVRSFDLSMEQLYCLSYCCIVY